MFGTWETVFNVATFAYLCPPYCKFMHKQHKKGFWRTCVGQAFPFMQCNLCVHLVKKCSRLCRLYQRHQPIGFCCCAMISGTHCVLASESQSQYIQDSILAQLFPCLCRTNGIIYFLDLSECSCRQDSHQCVFICQTNVVQPIHDSMCNAIARVYSYLTAQRGFGAKDHWSAKNCHSVAYSVIDIVVLGR